MKSIIAIILSITLTFASPVLAGDASAFGSMRGTAMFYGSGGASSSGSFDVLTGTDTTLVIVGGNFNLNTSNIGGPADFGFGFVSGNVISGGFASQTPSGSFASSGTRVETTTFSIGPVQSSTTAGGYAGACAGEGC